MAIPDEKYQNSPTGGGASVPRRGVSPPPAPMQPPVPPRLVIFKTEYTRKCLSVGSGSAGIHCGPHSAPRTLSWICGGPRRVMGGKWE